MELPKDLIREFAASTNDQQKTKKDTTCYGTVVIQNGGDFVQIDGADTLTPAIYTVGVKNGDRVLIMLKGRKALVVGNITSPYLMVGTLEANDGIIINGYLTTNPDRTTYDSTSAAGLTISNGGIGAWQGGATTKRWYGKNDGSFYASSAEITGTITAKDGSIGGFTIGENKLYSGQHNTWNANNSGVFISPDYIALGTGGLTYLKNDGTFQFGGANGVLFNGTKVTFGESVELNVNRIKGSKTLGDWGIDFDSGAMTIGSIAATKITGTKSLGNNWSIDFSNGSITIGSIAVSKITGSKTLGDWGINFDTGAMTIGSIAVSKITGSKTLGDWGINFDTGAMTIGSIAATKITGTKSLGNNWSIDFSNGSITIGSIAVSKITGSKTLGDWGINFDTGAMTIGNISASKIVSGTLTLGGNNNASGSLRINNASGTQIGGWTNAGISAGKGTVGGFTLDTNTFYSNDHVAWNTAKDGIYINSSANPTNDVVLSLGSGGVFYVTKQGVPHCNGSSLYINSAPAVGNDSSGIGLQISNNLVGEICMARESATVSNMELTSYNGGVSINGSTWIALFAPSVTTYGNVKITEGSNIYLKAATTDPGDLVFLDSSDGEMGRIWDSSNTLYFRAGPSGTDFIVGQSTNYSYNSLLVGASKSNYYTQPGVSIMTNGNITLTYDGGGAGIYFAYNKAAAYTVGLHESSSGTLSCTGGFNTAASIVCGSSSRTVGTFVKVWNSSHQGSLFADTSGKLGVYSDTNSCWAFYIDTSGEIYGHFAHSTRSDKTHKIIGSTATNGQRVELIRYGDTSGVIEFYAQDGSSGSSYAWRKPASSDIRLKENVKESTVDSLSILNKVKLYSFDWKGRKDHWDVGFIANYIVDVDPNLAYAPKADDEMYAINTFYMQGHIVKAIQQLTARIEELEKKLKGAA